MTETKNVCPQCNTAHTPNAKVCRDCGYRFPSQPLTEEKAVDATKKVCPQCSTVHTPNAKVCRECGYRFPSQLQSEEKVVDATKKVCPQCSTVHTPNAKVCRECGYRFPSQLQSEEKAVDSTKKVCPQCSTVQTSSAKFCKGCGYQFSSQLQSEEKAVDATKKVCPQCSTAHTPNAKVCRECGYRFPLQINANEDLLNRIASVEQKASSLIRFKSPVQALIAKAREYYSSGSYDAVRITLKSAEDGITSLTQCEARLKQWGDEGYITTQLELLKTDNINTINTVFRDFELDIATLGQLDHRLQELKRLDSQGKIDSVISQRIVGITSQLKDPHNANGIKREIEAIEQLLRDQQERSKQRLNTEQLLISLQAKAENLTLYAPLVSGLLKNAQDQYAVEQYDDARKTISSVYATIDTLLEREASLASWKSQGYITTGLEALQPVDTDEVVIAFRQYDQVINRLKSIQKQLASKKGSYPKLVEQHETAGLVLSIEQNLKDPAQVDAAEKDYQQLKDAIRQLEERARVLEQNIRDQAELVERKSGSPAIKREIVPIMASIRKGDIPRALDLLQGLADQQLSQVNSELAALRTDGAVVAVSSDLISQYIAAQHYGDAILDSEKAIADLTRIGELYAKAKVMRLTVTGPVIISLFENGKYEEFIRASEKQQVLNRKVNELKEKGRKLVEEAEKFGKVPGPVHFQLDAQDIPTIQSAITELESFSMTAKPELSLALDRNQLFAGEWHKVEIQINNTGKAHAFFVILSFSDDFETRRIKPVTIEAGSTKVVEIGIMPKTQGNIPIEVTLHYKDGNNLEYINTSEFWIDVPSQRFTSQPFKPETKMVQSAPLRTSQPPPITGNLTVRSLPPEMTEKYAESEFIGKGGFARVFKAKRRDGVYVAVKVPIYLDESTGKSFLSEMQNWTKFSHPNIVKIYDYNIMPLPYFEEELCDSSLDKIKKPLDSAKAAWIIFNICEGLKYAHARQVIHRDLKPQNILLKSGIPKISDWGLSKVVTDSTSSMTAAFTPFYAAPEQVTNKPKDQRTDIWQVGVILYELVTSSLPFTGDSMLEIFANIPTRDPVPPGEVNPEAKKIEPLILRCLEKDPAKRYQSVAELQKDLAVFLKMDFKESLKMSIGSKNSRQTAVLTSQLFLTYLKSGDLHEAYKYATDLVNYSDGEIRDQLKELSEQIRMRIDNGLVDVPDEIIKAADLIAHKIGIGLTTM
jgi:serine/threonine protein kinase/ribosomal protein L40E